MGKHITSFGVVCWAYCLIRIGMVCIVLGLVRFGGHSTPFWSSAVLDYFVEPTTSFGVVC